MTLLTVGEFAHVVLLFFGAYLWYSGYMAVKTRNDAMSKLADVANLRFKEISPLFKKVDEIQAGWNQDAVDAAIYSLKSDLKSFNSVESLLGIFLLMIGAWLPSLLLAAFGVGFLLKAQIRAKNLNTLESDSAEKPSKDRLYMMLVLYGVLRTEMPSRAQDLDDDVLEEELAKFQDMCVRQIDTVTDADLKKEFSSMLAMSIVFQVLDRLTCSSEDWVKLAPSASQPLSWWVDTIGSDTGQSYVAKCLQDNHSV